MARGVALGMILLYQKCLSRLKPPCCRFIPSCSEYARQAISRFGVLHGGYLALRRLLRCHPFYRGCAYDPVPPAQSPKAQPRCHQSGTQ